MFVNFKPSDFQRTHRLATFALFNQSLQGTLTRLVQNVETNPVAFDVTFKSAPLSSIR